MKSLEKSAAMQTFFRQFRKNYKNCYISKYEDENGVALTCREDIQECLTRQYSELYELRQSQGDSFEKFLTNLMQVQNENTDPYTLEECKKAVSDMEPGKCPGLDGIRIEFYKKHSKYFGPFFVKMLSIVLKKGSFQNNGIFLLFS